MRYLIFIFLIFSSSLRQALLRQEIPLECHVSVGKFCLEFKKQAASVHDLNGLNTSSSSKDISVPNF